MKILLKLLVAFSFLIHTQVAAHHWTVDDNPHAGWNQEAMVRKYFHNSDLQLQWAWHALSYASLSQTTRIFDFGCGEGKISAMMAASVPQGYVQGVDVSDSMIAFAQRKFPKRHYPHLTFEQVNNVSTIAELQAETFDLVTAFCVFHILNKPQPILNDLAQLLRPGGQALFVLPTSSPPYLVEAANECFASMGIPTPWSSEDYKQHARAPMREPESAKKQIEQAGFLITHFKENREDYVFYDEQELVDWLVGTLSANWAVPFEQAPQLFARIVERWIELYPQCKQVDGSIDFACYHLLCVAQRPKS